jgi:plasmid stabilization system protein ParE
MAYVVKLTSRAERDLAHLYEAINATRSEAARKSYQGLKKKILSLEKHPHRCPVTSENEELKHLMYGRGRNIYRVIYRVIGKQVEVLHIRHGARRKIRKNLPPAK